MTGVDLFKLSMGVSVIDGAFIVATGIGLWLVTSRPLG